MKVFYGWVVVAAGIVITCVGFGTALSLGVFLQPMSVATGWSRATISSAAMVDFVCMGLASLAWGAGSDQASYSARASAAHPAHRSPLTRPAVSTAAANDRTQLKIPSCGW